MKVVNIIKKVIIGILVVIFFSFVIAMTVLLLNVNDYGVTQLGDTAYIIINEEISLDHYEKGDLVLVEKKTLKNIEVGDEVFVYKTEKNGSVTIDVGVVGEKHEDDNALSFENGSTYSMRYIAGEASKVYNNIGTYLSIVQSKWGFLFIVLVPSFLFFVYEICALVIELKYGKESEN